MLLLAGPPAVGKSTVARVLAKQFAKSIHIQVDDLRDMVISGVVQPSATWSDGLVDQLRLARSSATYMAAAYSKAGFDDILDDFWDPHSHLQEYNVLQELPNLKKFLLHPKHEAAEARNWRRTGDSAQTRYISQGIEISYQALGLVLPKLREQG